MILDVSKTSLKTHKINTPYLGGLAIFGSALLASTLNIVWFHIKVPSSLYGLLLSCLVIIIVGLADDLYHLSPLTKIGFEVLAAYLAWLTGTKAVITGVDELDMLFTFVWIVGLSNAFNLIDIMDGLSSGVAAISSIFLSCICLAQGNMLNGLLLLALAGACCGFLKFNFNPAQIFMGDTGSLFLGFFLACSAIPIFQYKQFTLITLPIIVFGIPIFETIFLSVLRIKSGIPPWKGTKDHFALRLVKLGLSVRFTVLLTYLFCIALGSAAFIFLKIHSLSPYGLIVIIVTLIVIGIMLSKVDIRDSHRS